MSQPSAAQENDMSCNIKTNKPKFQFDSKIRLPRTFRADRALVDLVEGWCKEAAPDYPNSELNKSAVIIVLVGFVKYGMAVRYTDPDGNITWKATPKLLKYTGCEAGPLVTLGPFTAAH
jgi:hypothetical protein